MLIVVVTHPKGWTSYFRCDLPAKAGAGFVKFAQRQRSCALVNKTAGDLDTRDSKSTPAMLGQLLIPSVRGINVWQHVSVTLMLYPPSYRIAVAPCGQ